jgi:hypothetical protein
MSKIQDQLLPSPESPAPDETRLVQMRLRQETLDKLQILSEFFNASNRTETVARAIRLTHAIAEEVLKGGTIEVHRKDGKVCELILLRA